jgi:hypothetical protein
MITACSNHPVDKRQYLQNLSIQFWSSDEKFLYGIYSHNVNEYIPNTEIKRDVKKYLLKININSGRYEVLYEEKGEEAIHSVLDFNEENESFIVKLSGNDDLTIISKGIASGILISKQKNYYIGKSAKYSSDYKYIYSQNYIDASTGDAHEWGRYKLDDKSFLPFKSSAVDFSKIDQLNVYQDKYLYGFRFLNNSDPGDAGQHILGVIDLATATVLDFKIMSPHTDGLLKFRTWLSENELLFSVLDKNEKHIKSVSYNLIQNIYISRPNFQREGLLSPTKQWVVYQADGKLMISGSDGSSAREVLDIQDDLPKGTASYLPFAW